MIFDKTAIFIDTNVFEKKGFNFDKRNEVLEQYKKLVENRDYENISVSVIDNEIKEHIKEKISKDKTAIKKHCKWIYNIIDEDKLEENINKDLNEYEEFKTITNTINIDLNNINPEVIMSKYFNIEYPFESNKRYEFKDAFFLEAIYEYANNHEDYASFIVITNDNGIKKAIDMQGNRKIVYFNSIEEVLDNTIRYPIEDKKRIFDYIASYDFTDQISENARINIMDIEEEEIEIDNYFVQGIYFPKIIKKDKNTITVVCDININLNGSFKCLDYNNSYYSDEEREYVYKTYKELEELSYVCQTIVEVNIEDDKFVSAKIVDLPEIDIYYEDFLGEDNFST